MTTPRVVFLDTSFLAALFNRRDAHHARAGAWQISLTKTKARLLTTESVLWEFLNSLSATHRITAIGAYRQFHADPTVAIVGFEQQLVEEAMRLYESRRDKEWGITDCFSFVVMKGRHVTDALTADHHFQQAGFTPLLLQDPP